MRDLPEVLKPLVEFEDPETGEPVAVCDPTCGAIAHNEEGWHSDAWYIGWCNSITPKMKGDRRAHCPQCGSLVGLTEDDEPYRIRFSRIVEALAQADLALSIAASAAHSGEDMTRDQALIEAADTVRIDAALAATEEDSE